MDKRVTEKKEYNKGFSLFTVIVSIAFVGILGMLVLYMAIANFHMKITDLKEKTVFIQLNVRLKKFESVFRKKLEMLCLKPI